MNSGTEQATRRSPIKAVIDSVRPWQWAFIVVIVVAVALQLTVVDDGTTADRIDAGIFLVLAAAMVGEMISNRRAGKEIRANYFVLLAFALLMAALRLF